MKPAQIRRPASSQAAPVIREAGNFLNKAEQTLSREEIEFLNNHLRQDAPGKLHDALDRVINRLVEEAQGKAAVWESGKSHGARKVGAQLQTVADGFNTLLGHLSGVVSAVDGTIGQGYASVAYQGLSILLLLAVCKTAREKKLKLLLGMLSDTFPSSSSLALISASNDAKGRLEDLAIEIVRLVTQAVAYFGSNSFVRAFWPIVYPHAASLDDIQASVQDHANFIKDKALVKSEQRIEELLAKVSSLEIDLQRVDENLRLRTEMLMTTAETKTFGLSDSEAYRQRLELVCQTPKMLPKLLPFQWEKLQYNNEYTWWKDSNESSIFLLTGRSESRLVQEGVSWLSSAAFHIHDAFSSDGSFQISACFLQSFPRSEFHPDAEAVIKYLLWDMVEGSKPDNPVTRDPKFEGSLTQKLDCDGLRNFASLVLKHIQKLLVVIDRLDRCGQPYGLLRWLIDLVRNQGSTTAIKAFVVWGDRARFEMSRVGDPDASEVTHVVEMNQQKAGPRGG